MAIQFHFKMNYDIQRQVTNNSLGLINTDKYVELKDVDCIVQKWTPYKENI